MFTGISFIAYYNQAHVSEKTLHRCSYKKVFWKYPANLQENVHIEVQFQ